MKQILIFVLGTLAGSVAADAVRLSEPVEASASYEVFGAPLADKSPGMSLTEAIAQEASLNGKKVRLTTRVTQVCQKKGCFFVATEGAAWARVTFVDYSFFVPTDSAGKEVTLEGTFSRRSLTPEEAAHYQADLGEQGDEAPAVLFEYSIVATSVMLPRP